MTAVFIDIFPVCLLFIILYDLHRNHTIDGKAKGFRAMVLLMLLVLFADMAAWALDGAAFDGSRELHLAANIAYFALEVAISYGWFLFAYYILYGAKVFRRHYLYFAIFSLPMVMFIILLLVRPDWIINITPDNHYERGPFFFIQSVIGFGYMLIGCARAFVHGIRDKVLPTRKENFLLASFVLYPFVGGVVQIINSDFVLLWPLAVVSMVLYYMNLRHNDIQKDELTGIYNRRWLDEYLSHTFQNSGPEEKWHLLLIDVNHFKAINDAHGHTTGDEALQKTARILQEVFCQGYGFAARYGGDEFAVVINGSEALIPQYMEELQEALERNNREAGPGGYQLSLSCGGAAYEYGKFHCAEDLVAVADSNMYRNKKENRLYA